MNMGVASGRKPRPLSLVTNGTTRRAQSDVELARALQSGQAWAVSEVWHRLAPMVLAMSERCLGSRAEAEDVTQEVFYHVFRKANTLRDPESLRAFVYSFAIRILKSELRRRRVRAWLTFGDVPSSSHPVAAPDVELRDLLARFYRLLDRLSARDRLVFVLRRIEGMTAEEIAAHMAISVSTVKRSMKYASQQLTRWVEADARLKELLTAEVIPV